MSWKFSDPGTLKKALFLAVGLAVSTLAVGIFAWMQVSGATRTYEVQGRVAGFSDDPRTVVVEHERVPGYMPAMTMPLTARSADDLTGLQVGEAIRFTLAAEPGSTWIEDIRRLPDSAVARHPAGEMSTTEAVASSSEAALLQQGDKVPGFQLISQRGDTVRLADYRGKALVLTFMYTSCPLPNYCPLMSKNFAALQPRLQERYGGKVQLLSVSFDPKTDTPRVLKEYASRYVDELGIWTLATGTPEEIGRLASRFGVFTREGDDQIIHNLTTALIGPEGRVRRLWRGSDWTPRDVTSAVAEVVQGAQES